MILRLGRAPREGDPENHEVLHDVDPVDDREGGRQDDEEAKLCRRDTEQEVVGEPSPGHSQEVPPHVMDLGEEQAARRALGLPHGLRPAPTRNAHAAGRPSGPTVRTAPRRSGLRPGRSWPESAGAVCHGTMSCGDSSEVSIHRRHGSAPPAPIRWQLELERLPVRVQDHVHEQPVLPELRGEREAVGVLAPVRLPELHAVPRLVACRIIWFRLTRRRSCSTSRKRRRSLSRVTNRCTSACFRTSVQSNQLISLSWQ